MLTPHLLLVGEIIVGLVPLSHISPRSFSQDAPTRPRPPITYFSRSMGVLGGPLTCRGVFLSQVTCMARIFPLHLGSVEPTLWPSTIYP